MTVLSAGIVLWRRTESGSIEVLLAHMGGPFWASKDNGAWTIPKGVVDDGEAPVDAARREFSEELGWQVPPGDLVDLGEFVQSSKKTVVAWALELVAPHEVDLDTQTSTAFEMEWPRRSGRLQSFPEIDRAAWFDLDAARTKVVNGQSVVFDLLVATIDLD